MGDDGKRRGAEADPLEATTPGDGLTPGIFPLQRGAVVSRYVVGEVLGSGGMGVVYRAFDPELARHVALKVLHAEASVAAASSEGRARLTREAQALAKLAHPNVISVYDVGTTRGQVFLAMELVDGTSLGAWLRERRRPWREILRVFEQAGRGLDAAHRAGLVHRDFKPENVLIGRDGRVRVLDFGLARPAEGGADAPAAALAATDAHSDKDALGSSLTRTGAILGTPLYMAPEQHVGGTTDARTDQFSFCVALYEALVGAHPFLAKTRQELALNVARGIPNTPPRGVRLPRRLWRAILRGLRSSPAERFPSMHEFLAALDRAAQRARFGQIALSAAAVAAIAVAIGVVVKRGPDTVAPVVASGVDAQVATPSPWGPVETKRQVTFTGVAGVAELSPDGKRIAYVASLPFGQKLVVQDLATGASQEVYRAMMIMAVRWSPDGSRLSLGTGTGLTTIAAGGGDERHVGGCVEHAWSPDGKQLVSACQDFPVDVIDLRTGDRRTVPLPMKDVIRGVDWSPRTGQLLFITQEKEGGAVWTMRPDGSGAQRVHEDRDHLFATGALWSHTFDGFYYVGLTNTTQELLAVELAPGGTTTGKVTRVLENPNLSSYSWSGDERRLAYTVGSAYENLSYWKLGAAPPAHAAPVPITEGTHRKGPIALSPDGTQLAVAMGHEPVIRDLYLIPLAGGAPRELARIGAAIHDLAWSADGKTIAMILLRDDARDVWTVDVASGETRALHQPDVSMALAWAPGRDPIYMLDGNQNFSIVDLATAEGRKMLDPEGPALPFAYDMSVSPDGKQMIVSVMGADASGLGTHAKLVLVDVANGKTSDLMAGSFLPIGWSDDGRWIYAAQGGFGGPIIAVVAIARDGRAVRRLIELPVDSSVARVIPDADGTGFVMIETEDRSDIWIAGEIGADVVAAQPIPASPRDAIPFGHAVPPNERPLNLDLEQGTLGEAPTGWQASTGAMARDTRPGLDDTRPAQGARCLRIGAGPNGAGSVAQYFPSGDYRGKKLTMRAKLRTDGSAGARATLWMRTEMRSGEVVGVMRSFDDPATTTAWASREVTIDVTWDADLVNIGVLLEGGGTAWLDDVSLRVVR